MSSIRQLLVKRYNDHEHPNILPDATIFQVLRCQPNGETPKIPQKYDNMSSSTSTSPQYIAFHLTDHDVCFAAGLWDS